MVGCGLGRTVEGAGVGADGGHVGAGAVWMHVDLEERAGGCVAISGGLCWRRGCSGGGGWCEVRLKMTWPGLGGTGEETSTRDTVWRSGARVDDEGVA